MPKDSHISAAEGRRLRMQLAELTRKREQRYAEWDRLLADHGRESTLASQAEALSARIEELKQQMADTLAEAELAGADEPPIRPPLPEEGIFPSAEEAAAAAGPWSPEFQAWRKQHIPSSRGLF